MKPSEWRWFLPRSAIETVISHAQEDHRMDRKYLKGTDDDKMNTILAAGGFNLIKLLRALLRLLFTGAALSCPHPQDQIRFFQGRQ